MTVAVTNWKMKILLDIDLKHILDRAIPFDAFLQLATHKITYLWTESYV